MTLFTDGQSNTKTAKGSGKGFETKILHMAPAMESGYEVCASRSAGCTAACLYTAGRGRMENTKKARIRRTLLWFEQREVFKQTIITELVAFVKRNDKNGTIPTVRMNGTSDIIWEKACPNCLAYSLQLGFMIILSTSNDA